MLSRNCGNLVLMSVICLCAHNLRCVGIVLNILAHSSTSRYCIRAMETLEDSILQLQQSCAHRKPHLRNLCCVGMCALYSKCSCVCPCCAAACTPWRISKVITGGNNKEENDPKENNAQLGKGPGGRVRRHRNIPNYKDEGHHTALFAHVQVPPAVTRLSAK